MIRKKKKKKIWCRSDFSSSRFFFLFKDTSHQTTYWNTTINFIVWKMTNFFFFFSIPPTEFLVVFLSYDCTSLFCVVYIYAKLNVPREQCCNDVEEHFFFFFLAKGVTTIFRWHVIDKIVCSGFANACNTFSKIFSKNKLQMRL